MNTIKEFWSGDEWIPVEMLSESTGILKESSLNNDFGYQDMVLLDSINMEISQVIKKNTNTIYLGYDVPFFGDITTCWKKINQYFENRKLYIQKHTDGVFFLSIPINFDADELKQLIEKCPVKCYEITQENNSEDIDEDDLLHLN